jgi:hypothetical protein
MSDVPSSTGWTDSAARRLLRNVFDAAVASADPGAAVLGHLPEKPKGRCVEILWIGVTAHPTAEWVANQLTQACGWEQIPRYLIRDRDGAYGEIYPPCSIHRHSRPSDFCPLTLAERIPRKG